MKASPLASLPDDEARQLCRAKIESLEHWLRRLIHEVFEKLHGPEYAAQLDASGNPILGKKRVDPAQKRRAAEPARYPRLVDAMLLGDLVDLVLSFWDLFRPALKSAFPEGADEARTFLRRVEGPRNALAHANSVSLRAMEQVLCYSNDVIDSLKDYYREQRMEAEYDVPLILALRDFRGRTWRRSEFRDNRDAMILQFLGDPDYLLRPGDELALEVEVDPAFISVPYTVQWWWSNAPSPFPEAARLVIPIEEQHIMETFAVLCSVTTSRVWHRFGRADDALLLQFKVVPR